METVLVVVLVEMNYLPYVYLIFFRLKKTVFVLFFQGVSDAVLSDGARPVPPGHAVLLLEGRQL